MPDNLLGQTLGDFRIEALLGRGGVGRVYRALQLSLARPVAVKVLEDELFLLAEVKERFLREAAFIAQLEHPHIIPVYATGHQDNLYFYAMKLVAGKPLSAHLAEGLPMVDGIRYCEEVAGALAYAHERGIIHRDVKPANILIDEEQALLADFGLARLLEGGTITASGALLGTPLYFSPEQVRGERASARSDIFALGIILYQVATGRHPFRPSSADQVAGLAVLQRIVAGAFDPPRVVRPELPAEIERVILRALAADPTQRHPTAQDLRNDLRALLGLPAVAAPPVQTPLALPTPSAAPAPEASALPTPSAAPAPDASDLTTRVPPPDRSPAHDPPSAAATTLLPLAVRDRPAPAQTPGSTPSRASLPRPFGKYILRGQLGHGGMGVVFKAEQLDLRRTVALKLLRGEDPGDLEPVRRFLVEARAAARLRHPNIVPIHEVGEVDGKHYFTMDWIDGRDLDSLVQAEALPPRRSVEILRDIARAVHYAHEQGIVHRDLKPANILVETGGRVLVTDFGLAKDLKFKEAKLSVSGQVMGTPAYMAPEQARGANAEVGPLSDVYALGAVLYRLTTGRPAFTGEGLVDVVLAVISRDPPRPRSLNPGVHADLETICGKAMEKDPRRRYASAADLADDLDRFLRGEPIAARPPSLWYRFTRQVARRKAIAGIAAGTVLVLAALVGTLLPELWRRDRHLAARKRLEAIQIALKEARPYRYMNAPDIMNKIKLLRGELEKLDAEVQTTRLGEFDEVWATLGIGWDFIGEDGRAETALARAEDLGTTDGLVAWVLGRICLERSVAAQLAPAREPSAAHDAQAAAWRTAARAHLRRVPAAWAGAEPIERDAAAACRAFAEDRRDDVARDCREALARYGDVMGTEEFLNLQGLLAAGPDRLDERVECYRKALKRRPHYPWGSLLRGVALAQKGDAEGARRDLEAALATAAPGWSLRATAQQALDSLAKKK